MALIPHAKLFEQTMPDGTERWLTARAAYDLRDPNPSKNYGIHGMEFTFGVRRGNLCVTWTLMPDWYLPHVRCEVDRRQKRSLFGGLGSIDYHSPTQFYEGQEPIQGCEYTGGDCYCDGSGLGARDLFDKWTANPDVMWQELEQRLKDCEMRVQEEKANVRNFS